MELKPHPQNLSIAPQAKLNAELFLQGAQLTARFEFKSQEELLVLPSTPSRQDELWKHTCFELFLQPIGEQKYWEINFRPTGDWNVYAFDSYRAGMHPEAGIKNIELKKFENSGGVCVCEFNVDLATISKNEKFRVGITAVIEMKSESKSYWAIAHAGDQPNFHLAESFVAELALTF